MRWKLPAGVLLALAVLVPAAPAMAEAGTPGLNAKCQTVERAVYQDLRKFITIDLDTATDVQVRILADQILQLGTDESLSGLPQAVQTRLDGTPEDLRAFLKGPVRSAWAVSLRISVTRTLVDAGKNVETAAQKVLDEEGATDDRTITDELAFLNDGVYAARALDCASHPTHSPSVTPSVTPSASGTGAAIPTVSASRGGSGGAGGGLAVTGADTGTVVAIGGALLLLGGAGYLITRRRRSRFVA